MGVYVYYVYSNSLTFFLFSGEITYLINRFKFLINRPNVISFFTDHFK